jgi:DNA-binding transcriptional LysR family regulator
MLETLIGMAEAGLGIAIIPSFVLPACRQREVVMIPLVDPVAALDLFVIKSRGRRLPTGRRRVRRPCQAIDRRMDR